MSDETVRIHALVNSDRDMYNHAMSSARANPALRQQLEAFYSFGSKCQYKLTVIGRSASYHSDKQNIWYPEAL